MLRICAGLFKGKHLKLPPESVSRPSSDRLRQAVFNILTNMINFKGLRVLDAFAGSGALGLEALSRGAAEIVFCENHPLVQKVLKENIASIGLHCHALSGLAKTAPSSRGPQAKAGGRGDPVNSSYIASIGFCPPVKLEENLRSQASTISICLDQMVQNIESTKLDCFALSRHAKSPPSSLERAIGDRTNHQFLPFDLIFLDPPYDKGLENKALEHLVGQKLISKNGIVVVEQRKGAATIIHPDFTIQEPRIYGKCQITILQFIRPDD